MKKKYLVIILLLFFVSFGYAIISTSLSINGTAGISNATWDIYFDNIANEDGVEPTSGPTINTSLTNLSYNVVLPNNVTCSIPGIKSNRKPERVLTTKNVRVNKVNLWPIFFHPKMKRGTFPVNIKPQNNAEYIVSLNEPDPLAIR